MRTFLSKNGMPPSARMMLLEAQQEPKINPGEVLPVEFAAEPDMSNGDQPDLLQLNSH